MKKVYFTFLLCLGYVFSFGQATLTDANMPATGDSARYVGIDTVGLSPGASGSGVTWDFSGATSIAGDTMHWSYITPPAGPLSSADLCLTNGPNFFYFNVDASGLTKVGENDSLFTFGNDAVYTDEETIFEFPYGMGSTTADSFAGSFDVFLGVVGFRKGADTSEVDGDGTLILPDGRSYDNVIRLHRHVVFSDSGSGFGYTLSNEFDYDIYEWWDSAGKFPMMRMEERVFTAFTAPGFERFAEYKLEAPMVVDTGDTVAIYPFINEKVGRLDVFPNPIEEEMNIAFDLVRSGYVRLGLYDLSGRKVRGIFEGNQSPGMHNYTFNRDGLPKGMYFLRLSNEEAAVSRKIIIH